MSILTCIEKLQKTDKPLARKAIVYNEFKNNRHFRELLYLIYGEVKIAEITKFPKFKKTEVPLGLDFSNLEKQLGKVKAALFSEGLSEERRNNLLIQIAGTISEQELDAVKAIMRKKWKYLSYQKYLELTNATV